MFEIEKGVPLPMGHGTSNRAKYKDFLRELQDGDSFIVPNLTVAKSLQQAAKGTGKRLIMKMERDRIAFRMWCLKAEFCDE